MGNVLQVVCNVIAVVTFAIVVTAIRLEHTDNKERVSREAVRTKGKNPVKAAGEFEIEKLPKAKRQTKAKVKSPNSSKAKKGR